VIPIFLQRIAQGLPIEMFGAGSTVRDYIYAEDAARMIVDTVDRGTAHDTYNIASSLGTTLDEVIEHAREVTGLDVVVERHPAPTTFVDRVVLDTTRYSAEFGTPRLVPLREGMSRTWQDLGVSSR
jgi:UDP-glucose 4-epimerase